MMKKNKTSGLLKMATAAGMAALFMSSGVAMANQQSQDAHYMENHTAYKQSKWMRDFPKKLLEVQPPWNKPIYQGTEVTVPGLENVPDIHGDINNPQLVIFFAGNQYMLVNRLMRAFVRAYPQYHRVVAFTFPPGRLIKAVKRGNGILLGNMHITLKPDVLTAGHGSIMSIQKKDGWFSQTEVYAKNRLAIMVHKGNPDNIHSLKQLGAPSLRICMPNPQWEGIAKHAIIPALRKAGGEQLVREVYHNKVEYGTTFLTHIHHRETPIGVMDGKCVAGVVWYTEAYFHSKIAHHPISIVPIPAKDNKTVAYTAGLLRTAPHAAAGRAFMKFLLSPTAQKIYTKFGFMRR